MAWTFEKFRGDMTIYAFCPKCSFHYNAGPSEDDWINKYYFYCPMCGKFLGEDIEFVDVIWNERNIEELWEQELAGERRE